MRTLHPTKLTVAIAIAGALAAGAPTHAAPLTAGAAQLRSAPASAIEQVRSRGSGAGAVIGGLAAGMILGGIIASQPHYYYGPGYYYGPPPPYYPAPYYYRPAGPPDWEAYCASRYRSFDPYTGTYMGYDGVRRPCR
jgi:hypothetical protein